MKQEARSKEQEARGKKGSQGGFFLASCFLLLASCLLPLCSLAAELGGEAGRLAIRNQPCACAGENVILTTIGVETRRGETPVFHPYLSVAVDKTYSDDGQWIALWNLSRTPPGWLSKAKAAIPFFPSSKKVSDKKLEQLAPQQHDVGEAIARGHIKPPAPYLTVHRVKSGSDARMVAGYLPRVLWLADVFRPLQFLVRVYLLNWREYQETLFHQAFAALNWYADVSSVSDGESPVSIETVNEIMFRLITNRSIYGRLFDDRSRETMVLHFESRIRDRVLGTASYLQSAANEYHLGYDEILMQTEGRIPVPVGALLYYDPALAPASDQVTWSIANPFGLSYNPFTDPEVQRRARAAPGSKIPLAIHVYAQDRSFTPFVAIDFIRPGNPKARNSIKYLRQVGDQAIAVSDLDLIYGALNRVAKFTGSRKNYVDLAGINLLGLEELRMGLRANLYNYPQITDALLDAVDRTMLNPLIKPGRIERVTAQINYAALVVGDGAAVCRAVRAAREKYVRRLTKSQHHPLQESDFQAYRDHLHKRPYLRRIKEYAHKGESSGIPVETVREALNVYAEQARPGDRNALPVLWSLYDRLQNDFRFQISDFRFNKSAANLQSLTLQALKNVYAVSGKGAHQFDKDKDKVTQQYAEQRARAGRKWEKFQAKRFERLMKKDLEFLRGFVTGGGDLRTHSPWYLRDAIDFLRQAPEVARMNPKVKSLYQREAKGIHKTLDQVEQGLMKTSYANQATWLEEERDACLRSLRATKMTLSDCGLRIADCGFEDTIRKSQAAKPQFPVGTK